MADDAERLPNCVSVRAVDDTNRGAAVRLRVAEEHLPYVAPVAEMLGEGPEDGTVENHVILAGDEVVGFFRLDFDRERVARYAGRGSFCGLRGFLIGRGHQGRGYGRAAIPAIRRLLRRTHPEVDHLVLTVNRRNAAAVSTYLKTGFRDTGKTYHGGQSGPQHVFVLPLAQKRGAVEPPRPC